MQGLRRLMVDDAVPLKGGAALTNCQVASVVKGMDVAHLRQSILLRHAVFSMGEVGLKFLKPGEVGVVAAKPMGHRFGNLPNLETDCDNDKGLPYVEQSMAAFRNAIKRSDGNESFECDVWGGYCATEEVRAVDGEAPPVYVRHNPHGKETTEQEVHMPVCDLDRGKAVACEIAKAKLLNGEAILK